MWHAALVGSANERGFVKLACLYETSVATAPRPLIAVTPSPSLSLRACRRGQPRCEQPESAERVRSAGPQPGAHLSTTGYTRQGNPRSPHSLLGKKILLWNAKAKRPGIDVAPGAILGRLGGSGFGPAAFARVLIREGMSSRILALAWQCCG